MTSCSCKDCRNIYSFTQYWNNIICLFLKTNLEIISMGLNFICIAFTALTEVCQVYNLELQQHQQLFNCSLTDLDVDISGIFKLEFGNYVICFSIFLKKRSKNQPFNGSFSLNSAIAIPCSIQAEIKPVNIQSKHGVFTIQYCALNLGGNCTQQIFMASMFIEFP